MLEKKKKGVGPALALSLSPVSLAFQTKEVGISWLFLSSLFLSLSNQTGR